MPYLVLEYIDGLPIDRWCDARRLGVAARLPYLFAAAITGFLLVAPMLAAGLYELSRRYLAGEQATLVDSMWAWRRNPSALVGFALLSILAGTAWQVASVVIVALFYKGPALAPMAMMIEVLVNPQHYLLFFVYMCVGGLLAALVFAVSVVSMPMLVDTTLRPADGARHQRQRRRRESAAPGAVGDDSDAADRSRFRHLAAGHDRDPALARARQLPRLQRPGPVSGR